MLLMGSSYQQYDEIQTYDEDCLFFSRRINNSNSKNYKFSHDNFKIKSNEDLERISNSHKENEKLAASTNYNNNNLDPINNKNQNKIRILVAESDPEVLSLFKSFLDSFGLDSVTVDSGKKVIDLVIESNKKDTNFDVIVLDTHLYDIHGLNVAKEIRAKFPNQRIIIVSTSLKEELSKELPDDIKIDDIDILTKPFKISNLISRIIKETRYD